jgi:hypothetical protein
VTGGLKNAEGNAKRQKGGANYSSGKKRLAVATKSGGAQSRQAP